jgi:hypothetical protein
VPNLSRRPSLRAIAGVAGALALVLCVGAAPANADTAALTFLDATGKSDPVADVGRTLNLVGNTSVSKRVYLRVRPNGGAPCAPSASSDSGSNSFGGFSGPTINDSTVNGNFKFQKTGAWPDAGTFLFCVWLADTESSSVTPISQVITFRNPTGVISATVNPAQVQLNQTATVTISGSTEAPEQVYATVRPAGGAACATSYDADSGRRLVDGTNVNGAFSVQATTTQGTAGDYVICLWLAESSSSGTPIAGPQPTTFSVLAPPPPPPPPPACVVPVIPRGTAQDAVVASLTAANCVLGKRTYASSRSYPRGTLIKLKTASGTSLDSQAAVDVVISTGTPCRVPSLRPGTLLSTAKARILAAGCTVGTVRSIRSRTHRKGVVLAYGPAPGTRLKPRATVSIVVSRGRH